MCEKKTSIMKLYDDAYYYHLIHNGYKKKTWQQSNQHL